MKNIDSKLEAFEELEKFIITSISSDERQHININVAKRVVKQLCKERDYWKRSFCKQVEASRK